MHNRNSPVGLSCGPFVFELAQACLESPEFSDASNDKHREPTNREQTSDTVTAHAKGAYIANFLLSSIYTHTHRQARHRDVVCIPVGPQGLSSRLSPSCSSVTLLTSTMPTALMRFSQPPNGLATPRTAATATRCGTGMWMMTHPVPSPVNDRARAGGSCAAAERSASSSSIGSGSSPRSMLACLQVPGG